MRTIGLVLAISVLVGCGAGGSSPFNYVLPIGPSTQQKQEARNQVKAAVSKAVVAKLQEIGFRGAVSSIDIMSEAYAQGGAMAFIARAKAIGTKSGKSASLSFEVFGRTTAGGGVEIDMVDVLQ